ncbi:hypothetical protein PanWU01x14_080380 [Parasponia andersonii]|uniref:F-box associated domain-containing protein n=1 Tax=Parasponia andersonii TaxID=3476 RepID=A0A2P5DAR0_PARAD|nr:hypothetical protein PanWU01x14_080380 [Parasponia andersonii]
MFIIGWVGSGMVSNWPQDAIISFTMFEEEFRRIPLPDHVQRTRRWYSLALWKSESVVLFGSTELNTLFPASFEMWVMVIEETRDGLVASYNPYNRSLRKLPTHETVLPGVTHAELFTKSLVSVKGGRCFT